MSTQRYVSGLAVTARLYCGGMALLYRATLRPSKLELLASYLGTGDLSALGSYRFDDPTGEVGIETHLVKSGADVLHIPLTYRSEPLGGAEEWGIGTLDHSVLGKRWVYSGCADPVYATELIRAILTGGTQVEQYFEEGEERLYREPTATVLGSGAADTPVPKISGVHAESLRRRHLDRCWWCPSGRAPWSQHPGTRLGVGNAFGYMERNCHACRAGLPALARRAPTTVQAMSELQVNTVGTTGAGTRLLVLIHGYGADEFDLAGLVPHIDPDGRFFTVCPRGPRSVMGFGAGWLRTK